MNDIEFLMECASLFRPNDPERASRLEAIASMVRETSGRLPFVDDAGLHVWVFGPSGGSAIPVPEEKVIPLTVVP